MTPRYNVPSKGLLMTVPVVNVWAVTPRLRLRDDDDALMVGIHGVWLLLVVAESHVRPVLVRCWLVFVCERGQNARLPENVE